MIIANNPFFIKYKPRTGISTECIFVFCMMIPFFKTDFFNTIGTLDLLFNVFKLVSAIIVIALVFLLNRVNHAFVLLLIYEMSLAFSTFINGVSFYTFIAVNFFQFTFFCLFYSLKYYYVSVLKVGMFIGEIMTYANLLLILLFPDGMYKTSILGFYHCWLLGYKNMFLPFLLIFAVIALLHMDYFGRNTRPVLLIVGIFLNMITAKSVTGLLTILLFFISMALVSKWKISFLFLYIISYVGFGMIVIIRILNFFGYYLNKYFGKDITLTGRTEIWDRIIRLWQKKPILGHGILTSGDVLAIIKVKDGVNAHDQVLDILFSGGILSLMLWMIFILYIYLKLESFHGYYISLVLACALFAYNTASITEYYDKYSILTLFYYSLSANIEDIIRLFYQPNQQISVQ